MWATCCIICLLVAPNLLSGYDHIFIDTIYHCWHLNMHYMCRSSPQIWSHDPSEIILIGWFAAQKLFIFIINVELWCLNIYSFYQSKISASLLQSSVTWSFRNHCADLLLKKHLLLLLLLLLLSIFKTVLQDSLMNGKLWWHYTQQIKSLESVWPDQKWSRSDHKTFIMLHFWTFYSLKKPEKIYSAFFNIIIIIHVFWAANQETSSSVWQQVCKCSQQIKNLICSAFLYLVVLWAFVVRVFSNQ